MLCTKCGAVIRPVVAIDIDGTLGDYHGHFITFVEAYLGARVQGAFWGYNGGREGSFRRYVCETYNISEATWYDIKLAYRQGAQKRSMAIIGFADHFMHRLRQKDIELWITTTRPHLRLDGIDPDTRAWLAKYEIKYDGLLYDEDKYQRLAERVDPKRVVAVLDDLVEQCEAAARLFGDAAILKRGSYNGKTRWDGAEVRDWDDALNAISCRIKGWIKRGGTSGGVLEGNDDLRGEVGATRRTVEGV